MNNKLEFSETHELTIKGEDKNTTVTLSPFALINFELKEKKTGKIWSRSYQVEGIHKLLFDTPQF